MYSGSWLRQVAQSPVFLKDSLHLKDYYSDKNCLNLSEYPQSLYVSWISSSYQHVKRVIIIQLMNDLLNLSSFFCIRMVFGNDTNVGSVGNSSFVDQHRMIGSHYPLSPRG